jgi:hypothetical protein
VRSGGPIRVARSQVQIVESRIKGPRHALRVRHQRQNVSFVVANAGGAVHRPIVCAARITKDDSASLFELVEIARVPGEAALAVRRNHSKRRAGVETSGKRTSVRFAIGDDVDESALEASRGQVARDRDLAEHACFGQNLRAVA